MTASKKQVWARQRNFCIFMLRGMYGRLSVLHLNRIDPNLDEDDINHLKEHVESLLWKVQETTYNEP